MLYIYISIIYIYIIAYCPAITHQRVSRLAGDQTKMPGWAYGFPILSKVSLQPMANFGTVWPRIWWILGCDTLSILAVLDIEPPWIILFDEISTSKFWAYFHGICRDFQWWYLHFHGRYPYCYYETNVHKPFPVVRTHTNNKHPEYFFSIWGMFIITMDYWTKKSCTSW